MMISDPGTRARQTASLLFNLAVAVLSAVGTVLSYAHNGAAMLRFYTVDSNLFAMLACLVYAVFLLRQLTGGKPVPVWAAMAKYMAVCCLGVTFVVVVAVLAPMYGLQGYRMMLFSGDMLYHHFLCPVLAALSFFLFDRVPLPARRAARIALLPTALYAAVLVLLNLTKAVVGPYPFLMVYRQPVWASCLWCGLILGGAYGLARLLARRRA